VNSGSMLTPFSWHHLMVWHLALIPCLLLSGALLGYVWLAIRIKGWSIARTSAWMGAVVITFIATQSVIGNFDMEYFSDHMIQHLMLIMVAAPLFALGQPLKLAEANFLSFGRLLASPVGRALGHPLTAFALYLVLIPLTHLSGLTNLMMQHQWIHHLEQIAFLFSGYLFFRVAFGLEGNHPLHPGLRLVFVMAAVPVDTITGLALSMSSHNPIPAYAMMAPMTYNATDILNNVRLGGAIMWIGGDALMLLACIPIALHWVREESRRTVELDAELDRLGI
jgi:cytochrome c oxidase assembly factor CtaG